MNNLIRQGDVFLSPVVAIPKSAKKTKRDDGRVVLAYGEVTGHAHAIHGKGATLLECPEGRFLNVHDDARSTLTPVGEVTNDKFVQIMDASGITLRFDREDDRLGDILAALKERTSVTVPGEILRHEEHDAVIPRPGNYVIPMQREYVAPEIVRQVAD
jgi:hypothetical protein